MRKQYLSAPLPFVGQKRMYIKDFKEVLKQFPDDAVYVDLFGGSGLLSHITKWEKPDATVIYNDFDNYSQRLNNIGRTNALLAEIREIVGNFPRRERLSPEIREKILHLLDEEGKNGFMDYITLSTSLMFSMKYATDLDGLKKESFYNTVRQSNYVCDGYLDGLQVVSCDYKELVAKYRNIQNVVYLVDPPYLSTEVGTYRMRWRLSDYLDVLSVLVGSFYIYFTSDKSDILELCQWLGKNHWGGNPFAEAGQKSMHRTMNYSSSYTDIMLYKTVFNKAT
ncbi:DNA adenine methylase [Parabacteroides merdae]|uniref:DNA adenine methylase n=1 Tax=Parabacteroides merdae TaxID=46503 RepID=UPI0022E36F66|nr:DNA adenine methylase [Parabacteroides merdae]